jgi:DNA-binding IscR family transcriptional regulator
LSQKVEISETAIQNNIAKLKAKSLLERIGPDKGGYQLTGSAEVYRKADVVA